MQSSAGVVPVMLSHVKVAFAHVLVCRVTPIHSSRVLANLRHDPVVHVWNA